jgi:GT2 family glycosyltransferase/glycosyltransferase involved in cell wall biosynthesis
MVLKIGYILRHFPLPSETFIINEIIALQSLGVSVYPISLFAPEQCQEALMSKVENVTFHLSIIDLRDLAAKSPFYSEAKRLVAKFELSDRLAPLAACLADYVVENKFQLLHAHFATESALTAMLVAELTSLPFTFTAHAYDLFIENQGTPGEIRDNRLKILVRHASRVITISEFNKRFLLEMTGEEYEKKIDVVHCGIDIESFSPLGKNQPEKFAFLCVGRFVEKKGHEFLLRAFQEVSGRCPNARLKLIGEGPLKTAMIALCRELGIEGRVEFLGNLPSEQVREEMKRTHVFVLHSVTAANGDSEGIPVSLMEAAGSGLPVVATRHSGVPELVVDNVTGLLSEEKDVASLAKHLIALATDVELCNRLGDEGANLVKKSFNLYTEASLLKNIFDGISKKPHRDLTAGFACHNLAAGSSTTKPFVSIVIPAYNAEDTLALCLNSIAALSYPEDLLEVFLVDNCSTDSTVAIAQKYRVTVLHESSIKSSYAARNVGIRAAQGELIAFTDADCIVTPDWLTNLMGDWDDASIGCYSGEIEAYQPEDIIEVFSDREGILNQKGTLTSVYLPYAQTANAAFRKTVFDQIGLFDPEMTSGGDADLAWRMQKTLGLKIKFVPEALVYHKHRSSIKGLFNQFKKYELGKMSWLKHHPDYQLAPVEQRKLELDYYAEVVKASLPSDSIKYIHGEMDFVGLLSPFLKYIMALGTYKARTEREGCPQILQKPSFTTASQELKASIIICTFNRSELLMQSILALKDQNFPADRYEIIVVDNNSSDDTRSITESLASLSNVPIRYLFEANQGLSYARNTGIINASHEIIIFTDDDIDADENWLLEIVNAFGESDVACAGGPIRPVWPFEKPEWLPRSREGFLSVSEFETARINGEFSYPNYPWGANIAFRKIVFDKIGMFPTDLGRTGKSLLSNEEIMLCQRVESAGYRIKFAPNAVIHHKIAPERLRKSWMLHRSYWQGRSDAVLDVATPPFRYSRLREFSKLLVLQDIKDDGMDFDTCFVGRALTGYLFQLIIAHQDVSANGDFKKLRALKTFMSATSDVVVEMKQKILEQESLVEDRNKAISGLDQQLCESEQQNYDSSILVNDLHSRIYELENRLAERERQLAERDRLIAGKERQLRAMYDSLSWRITAPLRGLYEALHLGPSEPGSRQFLPVTSIETTLPTPLSRPLESNPAAFSAGKVLHFAPCSEPLVSIVIPVFNQFGHTYSCLASILANTRSTQYEVIIADDASQDETKDLALYASNVLHVRNPENLGFLRNCNHAAASARGKYIVFLNNDTNVQNNWLKHLTDLMEDDPTIGMTGSKLVYPDGRLQEAGGIIWNDANGQNYGRLDDPWKPEYNYVKDVDYISGASIMIRKELWDRVGGFDERFAPAYYEDTDLAFTVRKLGYRVVFQPQSVVVHFEGISHGTDLGSGIKSYQIRNKELFLEKWREVLSRDHFGVEENLFQAKDRSRNKKTVLFIDYQVPLIDMFAGSRTNYMYLRLLVQMGLNVKFIGADFLRIEPYSTELNRLGIETLDGDWYRSNWKQWIIENAVHLDYVLFNKPDPTCMFLDFIKAHTNAKVLYQGHDLHYLRLKRKYEVEGGKEVLAESAKYERIEKDIFAKSDAILTFSSFENEVISKLVPDKLVATVPLYFYDDFAPIDNDFTKRKNLLFVGGFGHTPNVDAVTWFSGNVLPIILKQIPNLVFQVIGANPPQEITSLESDHIRILGFVSDETLAQYYRTSRMVVVPLRFGAGVKGKTIEALYHGLPIVSTSVGIEGIPDIGSIVTASDTPEEFAAQVIALYGDYPGLLDASTRNNEFVKNRYSTEAARETMGNLLARLD